MSNQIQREAERVAKYKLRRSVVKKHFEEVKHMDIPKYPILVDYFEILHPEIDKMVQRIYDGFKAGKTPKYVKEGVSGTYYLHDPSGAPVSVFKPRDEEKKAVNNPDRRTDEDDDDVKRIIISSFIGGIPVGAAAAREIAAYYLDHPIGRRREGLAGGDVIGFAGVPPTMFIRCLDKAFRYRQGYEYKYENYKEGSLQKYMENLGSCDMWLRRNRRPVIIPVAVDEVHKLSVLDIRLANKDRHGGNILVHKNENGRLQLIPIDHGYSTPNRLDEPCKFVWRGWLQAHARYSNEIIKYINSLDVDKDLALLRKHNFKFNEAYARTLHVSTMLLKKGVNKGLTPSEIGNLMCNTRNGKTFINEIVDEADKKAIEPYSTTREAMILNNVSEIMDVRLPSPSQLAPLLDWFVRCLFSS